MNFFMIFNLDLDFWGILLLGILDYPDSGSHQKIGRVNFNPALWYLTPPLNSNIKRQAHLTISRKKFDFNSKDVIKLICSIMYYETNIPFNFLTRVLKMKVETIVGSQTDNLWYTTLHFHHNFFEFSTLVILGFFYSFWREIWIFFIPFYPGYNSVNTIQIHLQKVTKCFGLGTF